MTKRLGATPFADLLAPSIAVDPTIKAIADSLDKALDDCARAIPHLLIFARLANDSGFINPVPMLAPMKRLADLAGGLEALSPELLDLLAWQLHVESYDAGVSLQAKREMIQASLLLHRRHGTPWSVRHALETLLRVPATIRQWFEYGGEPYFFRARLDVSGVYVDIRWLLSAFQIVMDYKNVRSWLEWLETFAIIFLEKRTGVGLAALVKERFMLFFPYAPMPVLAIYEGLAISTVTIVEYNLNFDAPMPTQKIYSGLAIRTRAISKIGVKYE